MRLPFPLHAYIQTHPLPIPIASQTFLIPPKITSHLLSLEALRDFQDGMPSKPFRQIEQDPPN